MMTALDLDRYGVFTPEKAVGFLIGDDVTQHDEKVPQDQDSNIEDHQQALIVEDVGIPTALFPGSIFGDFPTEEHAGRRCCDHRQHGHTHEGGHMRRGHAQVFRRGRA